jgi:diguanylate cyclase (GGDEF)-like protein
MLTSNRRRERPPEPALLRPALLITGPAAAGIAYTVLTATPTAVTGAVITVYMTVVLVGAYRMQNRWQRSIAATVRTLRQDRLTGLATRPVMDDLLSTATRDRIPVTVALADIDGLHAVNATFGHAGGDHYIAAAARHLTRILPAGGTLVRLGGDEFTLLVPGAVTATDLAHLIRSALPGPVVFADQPHLLRASVGVHTSTGNAWHALACADAAMYTAKESGGDRVLTYDPDRDGIPEPDGTRPTTRRRDHDPTR